MRIGSRTLRNNLFAAPRAGVTDRPSRKLCKMFGAGRAVSEMVASNSLLGGSEKTRRRANHEGEVEPISVQIAGADPDMMAEAARFNVERGAQIVDINMGCPAKKVCNTLAGSALLKDEPLVGRILKAVVKAVNVPVTLKFRTGWDPVNKNALKVAKIAHPLVSEIHAVLLAHLHELYAFYGRETGVKVARKHISWYTKGLAGSASFRHHMNQLETCEEQLDAVNRFFEQFGRENLRLRYEVELAANSRARTARRND